MKHTEESKKQFMGANSNNANVFGGKNLFSKTTHRVNYRVQFAASPQMENNLLHLCICGISSVNCYIDLEIEYCHYKQNLP